MSDIDLLVRVSHLYYELDETQERIAEIVGVTRPQVSRLLKEARAEGIIEVRIIDPHRTKRGVAEQLQKRFGLRHVALCPRLAGPEDLTRRLIGKAAASYLRGLLREGFIVGVGGGDTLACTVDYMLTPANPLRVTVVPLLGGVSPALQANELARRLAHLTGGVVHELHSPGLVKDRAMKEAIIAHTSVQSIAALWHQLHVAVFGIGAAVWSERNLGAETIRQLEQAQAVGEFLARPFDLDGHLCAPELGERTVGIEPDLLARVPMSIAIAGGEAKVVPLLGALRGRFFKALVTDEDTAERLLEFDAASSPRESAAARAHQES